MLIYVNKNVSFFSQIILKQWHTFLFVVAGYKIIKKIGEGTFSEVVKTQSLKDGKFYACKKMKQTINRYVFCNKGLSFAPSFSCAVPTHCCAWTVET